MKVPVLLPNIFDHPFTYTSKEKLKIGDYVEEGVVLARIDQRTPTNTLSQANADLEVSKVRLINAKNQFERSKRLHGVSSPMPFLQLGGDGG